MGKQLDMQKIIQLELRQLISQVTKLLVMVELRGSQEKSSSSRLINNSVACTKRVCV